MKLTKNDILNMTIKEIKEYRPIDNSFISFLLEDPRTGVKNYAYSLLKQKKKEEEKIKKINEKKKIELDLYNKGFRYICGIDEVGRGPLAGPVVTAAVILPIESKIIGIDDSKKVSSKNREKLSELIKKEALCYSFGIISPQRIDELNILNATKKAMISSVARLKIKPDVLLIDAVSLNTPIKEVSLINGDNLSYSIGAASIIAKVKRDNYMKKQALKYPQYGFERNVGYGTKEHIEAIKKYGLTPIHRRTFTKKFI